MIESFRNRETRELFFDGKPVRQHRAFAKSALRKLFQLNEAQSLLDLSAAPGNHLERLLGDRRGQWSIRINERWRICFYWREGKAYDVEIADYH